MSKIAAAFMFAIVALCLPQAAHAKMMFGTDESINIIEDVKLKGAKDEALALSYKVSTQFFLAGIYVTDTGYVLTVKDDSKRFYEMPKGAELADFQKRGLLPSPLPAYSLNAFDYIIGYSLWIILAGFGLWSLFKFLRRERKEPDASPA